MKLLKTTNLFLLTTENTEEIFNWNRNVIEWQLLKTCFLEVA
jgi:hypothetical protein